MSCIFLFLGQREEWEKGRSHESIVVGCCCCGGDVRKSSYRESGKQKKVQSADFVFFQCWMVK